jgi:aminopeptidase YwaD
MRKACWIVLMGLSFVHPLKAQKLKKADKQVSSGIAGDMSQLGNDSVCQGHTPTSAAPAPCLFVASQLAQMGLLGEADSGQFVQAQLVDEGKMIGQGCTLNLDGNPYRAGIDFFPLAGSAEGHVEGNAGVSLNERGLPWIYDLKYDLESAKDNPGLDLHKLLENKCLDAKRKGATALVLYNSSKISDNLSFEKGDTVSRYVLPVIYLTRHSSKVAFKDPTAYVQVNLSVSIPQKQYYIHFVEGMINNGAGNLVLLHASLDTAGSAVALIELTRLIRHSGWRQHDYLIIGYSGGVPTEANVWSRLPKETVAYDVEVQRMIPDPSKPQVNVMAVAAQNKWESVFQKTKDNYLTLLYTKSSPGSGPVYPYLCFSTSGPVIPKSGDYDREALAIRYIYKMMEAADKP